MNANRIAPVAGSTWFWRGIAALEGLLLATVVAIGLAGRLPIAIAPSPVVAPAARVSAPAVAIQKGLIACKPCREEVLAAAQAQLSAPAAFAARKPVARQDAGVPASVVQKGLIACKPCREEALAATQATRITYETGASLEQQVDRRGAGPR
jgi:hypothetical protein